MIDSQEIIERARGTGPFFALAESGKPTTFAWGEGTGEELSCRLSKFYSPLDKRSELWSGFSLFTNLRPMHSETLERLPLISPVRHLPPPAVEEKSNWNHLCAKIADAIDSGLLQKVVPARLRSFPLHPEERSKILDSIFANLFAPSSANAYRFLVREKEDVFFGATPELLFRRENETIFVPAIAGTRSLSIATEAEAAADLMESAKEREEHSLVVEGIISSLRSLGLRPKAPKAPDILKVPGHIHLFTPISAEDTGLIPSEQLMAALHPTPAVGGWPKVPAQDFLFTHERWDRGLFASPILFQFPEKEICLVAIRSGLLRADGLHLFAGAGFVRESQAETEWAETDRKMDVLQSLLTGKSL